MLIYVFTYVYLLTKLPFLLAYTLLGDNYIYNLTVHLPVSSLCVTGCNLVANVLEDDPSISLVPVVLPSTLSPSTFIPGFDYNYARSLAGDVPRKLVINDVQPGSLFKLEYLSYISTNEAYDQTCPFASEDRYVISALCVNNIGSSGLQTFVQIIPLTSADYFVGVWSSTLSRWIQFIPSSSYSPFALNLRNGSAYYPFDYSDNVVVVVGWGFDASVGPDWVLVEQSLEVDCSSVSRSPTAVPTRMPTIPTHEPTVHPTLAPTPPTDYPTRYPTLDPTRRPTGVPTVFNPPTRNECISGWPHRVRISWQGTLRPDTVLASFSHYSYCLPGAGHCTNKFYITCSQLGQNSYSYTLPNPVGATVTHVYISRSQIECNGGAPLNHFPYFGQPFSSYSEWCGWFKDSSYYDNQDMSSYLTLDGLEITSSFYYNSLGSYSLTYYLRAVRSGSVSFYLHNYLDWYYNLIQSGGVTFDINIVPVVQQLLVGELVFPVGVVPYPGEFASTQTICYAVVSNTSQQCSVGQLGVDSVSDLYFYRLS